MELLDMARTCGACGLKTQTQQTQGCGVSTLSCHMWRRVTVATVMTFGGGGLWHIALAAMHGMDVDVVSLNTLMSILSSSLSSSSFTDKNETASWSLALHLLPKLQNTSLTARSF